MLFCTDYVEPLMNTVYGLAAEWAMNEDETHLAIPVPPPLCDAYHRPDKEAAVQSLLSRFSQNQQSGSQCSPGPSRETRP